jgi:hypothetical protein
VYTFTVDDLAGGFRTRYEAREIVDELIAKSLEPEPEMPDSPDLELLREYEAQMADKWGLSPEAIAAQENWTEAP